LGGHQASVAVSGMFLVDAKASVAMPFFIVVLPLNDCRFLLRGVALFFAATICGDA
jgi:hypothetical protein